jgi:lysozyme family protein
MDFDMSFHELLRFEGGYVNHPSDPGGETNWGITVAVARQYGHRGPMKELPIFLAKQIYRQSYWEPCRADELPAIIRYAVFDASVNAGVSQSIKWLQRAVGTEPDGKFGPKTLAAVKAADPQVTLRKILAYRLVFFTSLRTWSTFGKGWIRRVAEILETTT